MSYAYSKGCLCLEISHMGRLASKPLHHVGPSALAPAREKFCGEDKSGCSTFSQRPAT